MNILKHNVFGQKSWNTLQDKIQFKGLYYSLIESCKLAKVPGGNV
jgi:hypothetical protein